MKQATEDRMTRAGVITLGAVALIVLLTIIPEIVAGLIILAFIWAVVYSIISIADHINGPPVRPA